MNLSSLKNRTSQLALQSCAVLLCLLLVGLPQAFAQATSGSQSSSQQTPPPTQQQSAPAQQQNSQPAQPATQKNPAQPGSTLDVDPSKGPLQPIPSAQPQPEPLPNAPSASQQTQSAPATLPPAPQQQAPPAPEGTAVAGEAKTDGGPASKPAGTAIAPAKQRQVRSLLIKIGAIAAGGAALGAVYALSRGTSSTPSNGATMAQAHVR